MNLKRTLLVCLGILIAGAAILIVVFRTEPTAVREGATKQTAMLVEVTEVRRGDHRPAIVAMGTIQPSREIRLRPRVAGEVVELAPGFGPGGFVEKGETLLRIDPSDYQNALQQHRSDLQQALADLRLEEGRRTVAEKDYELLGESLAPENRALVLREPQLEAIRARVEAARAAVAQAELDLERTRVRAPFDAHVIRREANVGSQVDPGDELAHLVGIDTYWIETTVPLSKLRWIEIPNRTPGGAIVATDPEIGSAMQIASDASAGSVPPRSLHSESGAVPAVQVHARGVWPEGTNRLGSVHRLIGSLEERTRMARVLVTVPDPLGLSDPSVPELILGSFVEVRIEGRELPDVVRLERDLVRKDDTVWVMEGDELRVRDLGIVVQDELFAYVASGLEDGDQVVTTNLSTVVDGAKLRLEPVDSAMEDPAR